MRVWGGKLLKTTSEIYYRSLEEGKEFDVIFIDGDHRFIPALQDMVHWFSKLKVGGVLIVDDYANTDTPQVTAAVNWFLEMYQDNIASVDEITKSFKNKGKHIPVFNKDIFIFKKSECKNNYSSLYIWGTGDIAKKCIEKWNNKVEFSGVLDNYGKGEKGWEGIPCCKVTNISRGDSLIVVATDDFYQEIAQQLKNMGFIEHVDFIKYSIFDALYVKSWDR